MKVPVTVFARGSGTPVVGQAELREGVLDVVLHDGTTLAFTLTEVDAKLGGASGTMLYLVSREHGATATVDVPGFAAALKAAAKGALDAQLVAIARRHHRRLSWDRILAVVALGLVAGAVFFVASLPRILRASVDALPRSIDRRVGDIVVHTVARDAELANDPVLDDAVRALLARLEPHVPHDGFVYRTRVLASPDVNAFALPGGQIVVCAGLLARAERPEAVAGVLAHEMAHVEQRHALRAMLANLGLAAALRYLAGNVDFLPAYAEDGALLAAIRAFGREEEVEADTVGVRTMIAAGLDPEGLADVFRSLGDVRGSEMPGMLAWMSTHPGHAERIANVERVARRAGTRTYRPVEGLDWAAVQRAATRTIAETPPAAPEAPDPPP